MALSIRSALMLTGKSADRFMSMAEDVRKNQWRSIDFYEKNGFQFLYKDEKEQNGFSAGEKLRTRSMFFDLGILR